MTQERYTSFLLILWKDLSYSIFTYPNYNKDFTYRNLRLNIIDDKSKKTEVKHFLRGPSGNE